MEKVEEAALLPAAPTLRSGKLDRPVQYRFFRRSNFLALRDDMHRRSLDIRGSISGRRKHATVLRNSSSISVPVAVLQICSGAPTVNLTHSVALVTIGNHDPTPSLAVGAGRGL